MGEGKAFSVDDFLDNYYTCVGELDSYNQTMGRYFATEGTRGLRNRFISRLKIKPKNIVVELGAGTAANLAYLPSCRYIGVDRNRAMLDNGKQRNKPRPNQNTQFILADNAAVPLADHTADVVLGTFALSGTYDKESFAASARRILRPGGKIAVLDFVERSDHPHSGNAGINLTAALALFGPRDTKLVREYVLKDENTVIAGHVFTLL